MKYEEIKGLNELGFYRHILVTGPQRSGTTIAAHILAHDLEYEYVDERDVGVRSFQGLFEELNSERKSVIQGPCYASDCHWIDTEDTAIVFMIRDCADIVASETRISWPEEQIELANYYTKEGPISNVRYRAWFDYQKHMMRVPYYELQYESLSTHPLWVEKPKRAEFHKRQWKEQNEQERPSVDHNPDVQPL